ncbi:uncharacterized protein BP01DRAFT_8709 [Aspergillus saccharolyticus JOP 1030-1]|uniref:Uncharacterized protein n=1 Tax=Aspergillus saccharolyticus JOP 1030-1 TaxID=1450539 RepID=A0A318ZS19_9EURO|nr:hypothetical protein BP01DRAFT_8709 [Aspergillus saccharolyticus JOP 1030-1]PYH49887.1 hypothetical protein BP01DRAFT_8709 [Aspergillus saccharolyticus JOP 1030-1]
MSDESLPISPSAFAEAIKELPLPVLYAKVSEIRNSIAHLHRSNAELETFIKESCDSESEKRELESYIMENKDVVTAMTERVELLKTEVENRGQQWIELGETDQERKETNGDTTEASRDTAPATHQGQTDSASTRGNASGDTQGGEEEEEEGVYL